MVLQVPGVQFLRSPTGKLSDMDAAKVNAMYGCDCLWELRIHTQLFVIFLQ